MNKIIERLDHFGRGITYVNDKITFVKNALIGEEVEIKITKMTKKYNEAEVTKIIKKSDKRQVPPCKYYNLCGGCDIMHMNYDYQIEFKKEKIKNILKKYANIEITPNIIKSNKELNYRNKITLHYKNKKLGYMKNNTNEIIEIDACPLAMEEINEYIKNNKNKEDLIIRENVNKEIITNIDKKTMIENINGLKFNVDTSSFFQVNHYICGEIFKLIEKNINECNTCLDLYCGVGTLSIVASKKSKKVYGIEINKNSYQNALKNLEINNIKNVEFLNGKVEEEIVKIKDNVDLIITDPPRSGIDKVTIDTIKKLKPKKIIYISCDPMTLARDLKTLNIYNLQSICILDMFPNTHHVESFCVLNLI